jgi:hypothetical protein
LGLPYPVIRALIERLEERGFVYRCGGARWAASSRWIIHSAINCNLQLINETKDGSAVSRPERGREFEPLNPLEESGDAVAGRATKIFCALESSSPTQMGVERAGEKRSILDEGPDKSPVSQDFSQELGYRGCGDKSLMQRGTLSEVETRQNEVKTPKKSVENLTSDAVCNAVRNKLHYTGQVA